MEDFDYVIQFALDCGASRIPTIDECLKQRGQIIGSVEIIGCVVNSPSPWFEGPFGFRLKNPRPIDPFPVRGSLKFFDVDYEEPEAK